MTTLIQDILLEREFGRLAARVQDLREWATREKATLPPTAPDIASFDVVHLESLLCAIERAVPKIDQRIASELGRSIPIDEHARSLVESGAISQWLVAADVPAQWRARLRAAIASNGLPLVDVLSGLPVAPNVTLSDSTAPTIQTRDRGPKITTEELARGFDGVKWNYVEWKKTIKKRLPAWLASTKAEDGSRGNRPAEATWYVLEIARNLLAETYRGSRVTLPQINAAFRSKTELRPHRAAWDQYFQDHPELAQD